MKLNLGCGQRHVDGYVNIDISETNGKKPDVTCDIVHLPYDTGSVDEVMAIHVIEHIDRSVVLKYLREWARVLKPEGLLVLECPDILEACRELVKNPSLTGPHGSSQRTMWVIYGDPNWPDPLGVMRHKWGYSVDSLISLAKEAGFRNGRQEPAQYRLREPRDIRVVADK